MHPTIHQQPIGMTQKTNDLPGFSMSWKPNPFPHLITEDGVRLDLRHVRFKALGTGPTLNEQGEVEYEIVYAVSESEDATLKECETHVVLRGSATPGRLAQIDTDLRIVTSMYRMEREVRWATPPDLLATDVRDDLEKALAGAAPDGYGYGNASRYAEELEKVGPRMAETEATIRERIER